MRESNCRERSLKNQTARSHVEQVAKPHRFQGGSSLDRSRTFETLKL